MLIIDQDGNRYSLLDFQRMDYDPGKKVMGDPHPNWVVPPMKVVIPARLEVQFITGETLVVEGDEKIKLVQERIAQFVLLA